MYTLHVGAYRGRGARDWQQARSDEVSCTLLEAGVGVGVVPFICLNPSPNRTNAYIPPEVGLLWGSKSCSD